MTNLRLLLPLAGCLVPSEGALAQRTGQNAVASAQDAFGTSIGGEQIGIYSPDNVRNFSPVAAGNVRIEGLYFDQQGFVTDRVIDSRSVRVGISAQGFPFPAPTGIADYRLRRPGSEAVVATAVTFGPYGGVQAEADAAVPLLGSKLGLTFGAGLHRPVSDAGARADTRSYGVALRAEPAAGSALHAFYGRIDSKEGARPFFFTDGTHLPPQFPRARFFGQKWAGSGARLDNAGLIGSTKVAGFDLAAGLFHSRFDGAYDHYDLHFGTARDGRVADRVIVAERDNLYASTSGEVRLSRALIEGERRHALHLSLRGRSLDRRYGGSDSVSLGASVIGQEDFRPEPSFAIGPKTTDAVRQKTFGAGYELRWRGVGELSLGAQKTDYAKRVLTPAGALPESRDRPWLFSVNGAATPSDRLAIFAGYTTGLEESDVAPSNAVNRNEAPPAIRTRQADVGLRYRLGKMSLIAGLFEIEKPYFNLDAGNRFRQLGTLRNRGVEMSLAGQPVKGLNVNAGATWIDASVSGEQVAAGLIGDRPIGHFFLRTLANVQWTVPGQEALALTARFESTSDRIANRSNTLTIPARSVTSLGARYRATVGAVPLLVRGSVDNIFNTFGWNVAGGGFFIPNGKRRFTLTVAADI